MARFTFGGFGGDQVSLDPTLNNGFFRAGLSLNATGTFWSASTGGTQYTDLIDPNTSAALTGVSTSSRGLVVPFKGPDGITEGWLDFGAGRFKVFATDAGAYQTSAGVRGNGFVALGDSISTAADVAAGGAGYGAPWTHMTCALSLQRLNFLGNAGVSGQNSTQILARVLNVIALKPQIVTVLAGTNDLTQGVSFATWSANIRAIVSQLRTAGIRVVMCTIPPRGNTTYLATQITWNNWLRAFAQANGYDLLDFFNLLVDPTTGMYKSGYDSGDNLHPSQTAHIVMANYAVSQLNTASYSPIQARLNTGDGANLLSNPLLVNGSPTPTSWITSGSASADWAEGLVSDSDFDGQAWQVAFTSAASSANFRSFKSFSVNTGSGFSVGDTLLFCCKAKVTASSGITPNTTAGLRFRLDTNGGSSTSYTPVGATSMTHAVALLWFTTVVPTGTTSIQLEQVVGSIPVGASFTVRTGSFGVFNLSTIASTAP